MKWSDVGGWLSDNAGGLLGLAGSIATGNIPGGVAAVASLITEATGETDPMSALKALQTDPATMLKLESIAKANEADIRLHHREMLRMQFEDDQKRHKTQQETITKGDAASDQFVRHTRPKMARQSWWGGAIYVVLMEVLTAFDLGDGANIALAATIFSPAMAYMGFRTWDKAKQFNK